jgi:hypothetical protein
MEAADECWHFAQKCERWAGEEKDSQVRNAFYRMARGFTQLAFQERCASATGLTSSDAEAALTLLALGLTSKELSVPASRLDDGSRGHSVTKAMSDDLQKHDDLGHLIGPLPNAPAKGRADGGGRG